MADTGPKKVFHEYHMARIIRIMKTAVTRSRMTVSEAIRLDENMKALVACKFPAAAAHTFAKENAVLPELLEELNCQEEAVTAVTLLTELRDRKDEKKEEDTARKDPREGVFI